MPEKKSRYLKQLLVYTVFLFFAFALRVSLFDYGLPFVENTDSTNFYTVVNDNRGLIDAGWRNDLLSGYPPGYLWLYARVSDLVDMTADYNIHIDQQYYTANMRLVSVFAGLITLAAIIALAKLLSGHKAALIAASVYTISADVILLSVLSLPDPITSMFMILSALITVISFKKRHRGLALIATLVALVAIAFKYPVAPILLMPAGFFLLDLWQHRIKALPAATIALIMVLATMYYLLFINGGASLEIAETDTLKTNWLSNLFSSRHLGATFNLLFNSLGLPILILTGLSVIYPFVFKKGISLHPSFWLLLLTMIPVLGIVPLYLVRFGSMRYIYPAMVLLTVILAMPQVYLSKRFVWLAAGFIISGGLFNALPVIYEYRLPYTYAEAQFWVEENLPDESAIRVESLFMNRSITRYIAGYSGFKNFGILYAPDISWQAVDDIVDYVYLADNDLPGWRRNEAYPALDEMLLIKQIDNSGYYGPSIYIYDPDPLDNSADAQMQDGRGVLSLHSYRVKQNARQIAIRSYWQAPENLPPVDYSYVLYLTAADDPDTIVFQQDAALGHRRTSTWIDPNELLRGNIAPMTVSDDIPAGDYDLWLGVYYYLDGIRMVFDDDSIGFHLADIRLP